MYALGHFLRKLFYIINKKIQFKMHSIRKQYGKTLCSTLSMIKHDPKIQYEILYNISLSCVFKYSCKQDLHLALVALLHVQVAH